MFKNIKKDLVDLEHPLKKKMASLLSTEEANIKFLPKNSNNFNQIVENSIKAATINLKNKNKEYNLQLHIYAGAPLILECSGETSYLAIRTIDIV